MLGRTGDCSGQRCTLGGLNMKLVEPMLAGDRVEAGLTAEWAQFGKFLPNQCAECMGGVTVCLQLEVDGLKRVGLIPVTKPQVPLDAESGRRLPCLRPA